MSLNENQFHVVRSTHDPQPEERFGYTYSGDRTTNFVVVHDDRPVGRAVYHARNGWRTPDNYKQAFDRAEVGETPPMFTKDVGGYVDYMAVHPDWQGHGLGKELAHRVLERHWEENPEQFGAMPRHSSLSSASGGMIEHLVPGAGTLPGSGWDEDFDPEDHGIRREDYGYDEDNPDWDGEWDEHGYDADVADRSERAAREERDRFAFAQMSQASFEAFALSEHRKTHRHDPLRPGTSLRQGHGWDYSIAPPTKYTQEDAQHLVNYGPEFFADDEYDDSPDEPEAPKPRPFRNGQYRLPDTFQRRLP